MLDRVTGSGAAPLPLSRREQKKLQTRQRIIAVAADAFISRGYDEATVEDIARAAGVSKPTFFNYFPSKQSVLEAIAAQSERDIVENVEGLLDQQGSPPACLLALFNSAAEHYQRLPALARLLQRHSSVTAFKAGTDPAGGTHMPAFMQRLLTAGRERGDFPSDDPLIMQVHLLVGVYREALAESLSGDERSATEHMRAAGQYAMSRLMVR